MFKNDENTFKMNLKSEAESVVKGEHEFNPP
jgi:hypothetical protein